LELQYSSPSYEINDRVAINHVTIASIYRKIYNHTEALEHLSKAEEILNEVDPNNILFGSLYHNKGNIYRIRSDLYRTKEYYEYALDFYIRNGYQDTEYFAFVFSNYINLLFELEEYELAEQQLSMNELKSLNVSPLVEFRIHITNAVSYSKLGRKDLSEYHFEKAKNLLEIYTIGEIYVDEVTSYFYTVIDFHILYGEYDKALRECERALIFIESLDPKATKSIIIYQSDIFYRTATIHFRQGEYSRALDITNRSIDKLTAFLQRLSLGDSYTSSSNS